MHFAEPLFVPITRFQSAGIEFRAVPAQSASVRVMNPRLWTYMQLRLRREEP